MSGRKSPSLIQGGGLYLDFGRSAVSWKSGGRLEEIKSETDFRTLVMGQSTNKMKIPAFLIVINRILFNF